MPTRRNEYLDHEVSDASDLENGYDSEAAELSKGTRTAAASGRNVKRRKLSRSDDDKEINVAPARDARFDIDALAADEDKDAQSNEREDNDEDISINGPPEPLRPYQSSPVSKQSTSSKKKAKDKEATPGVIYLSSLPPYLKPSALRNLLTQRGFSPITRLFLTPASKAKSTSKKNSRQLYTEGWIEFASKKTARRCADSLNAQIIGGKKGGFYHDDLWNMKYLKGMGWSELMAGIREEKREQEGRRDEERRTIALETKRFVEGVEQGKRIEGMKRKRSGKAKSLGGVGGGGGRDDPRADGEVKRTWRQFEVKGKDQSARQKQERMSDDVKEVLGKIF